MVMIDFFRLFVIRCSRKVHNTHSFSCVLVVANRFFPSSKKCSSCGQIKPDLTLKDSVYTCDCGLNISRDLNGARGIYL